VILIDSQLPPSVWSTVLPVATLVVGWALGFLTELWKSKRDSAIKAIERREARLLRRNEFQRATFLDLQEALTELSESTGMTYGNRSFQLVNQDSTLLPHSLLEAYRKANTQVSVLSARVRDDSIRNRVMKLQLKFNEVVRFLTKEEAEKSLADGLQLLFELNDRIGQVLRELDELDDQAG
jgi:hypothetical protein